MITPEQDDRSNESGVNMNRIPIPQNPKCNQMVFGVILEPSTLAISMFLYAEKRDEKVHNAQTQFWNSGFPPGSYCVFFFEGGRWWPVSVTCWFIFILDGIAPKYSLIKDWKEGFVINGLVAISQGDTGDETVEEVYSPRIVGGKSKPHKIRVLLKLPCIHGPSASAKYSSDATRGGERRPLLDYSRSEVICYSTRTLDADAKLCETVSSPQLFMAMESRSGKLRIQKMQNASWNK
ncbi:hypothetical protein CLF_107224 [Clonorchis sinensis]|uniref:Uncharacterized protein n=1 Tax=Clonorchis sinensis TaxID=79923 RepID=G7YGD2_CLOSI|nr:hypothetical protein CLF_107224 [Clonorchis sinensis]